VSGFTEAQWANIDAGSRRSAETIVPWVVAVLAPRSVLDIGCGHGAWGAVFRDHGVQHVFGVDATVSPHALIPTAEVDLAQPFKLKPDFHTERYDLAVCVEVAEHLPPERAEGFVDDVCRSATSVLWSAAIPGQGGVGHLNEQWQTVWAERFLRNGWTVTGYPSHRYWDVPSVEPWYAQSLMVAWDPKAYLAIVDLPQTKVVDAVHPTIYGWRRETEVELLRRQEEARLMLRDPSLDRGGVWNVLSGLKADGTPR